MNDPTWLELANKGLDLDEAYTESLPPQMRFECAHCGRPPMAAAKRIRAERQEQDA